MRRFVISLSLSMALFVYASNVQAAPSTGLLDDGEFNNPTANDDVSNSAWTLDANKPDMTNLATRFQQGGFARSDGADSAGGSGYGVWYRSFEGNSSGSGEPLAESTLFQDYTTTAGGDYSLDFDWAREVLFTAATWGVSISSNGTGGSDSIDLLTATSLGDGNFNQNLNGAGINTANLSLSGVTAGDVLTVTAFMTDGTDVGGAQSAFLDNFVLTVPEPTSILLLGMGSVGMLFRRRR